MSRQYRENLYHGTVSEITRVDVSKDRGNKDFGKGFYMAVTKKQAVGMMHKKYREAIKSIYQYCFLRAGSNLRYHKKTADYLLRFACCWGILIDIGQLYSNSDQSEKK